MNSSQEAEYWREKAKKTVTRGTLDLVWATFKEEGIIGEVRARKKIWIGYHASGNPLRFTLGGKEEEVKKRHVRVTFLMSSRKETGNLEREGNVSLAAAW